MILLYIYKGGFFVLYYKYIYCTYKLFIYYIIILYGIAEVDEHRRRTTNENLSLSKIIYICGIGLIIISIYIEGYTAWWSSSYMVRIHIYIWYIQKSDRFMDKQFFFYLYLYRNINSETCLRIVKSFIVYI